MQGCLHQSPRPKQCFSTLATPWNHLEAFRNSCVQDAIQVNDIRLSGSEPRHTFSLKFPRGPQCGGGAESPWLKVPKHRPNHTQRAGPGSPGDGGQGLRARTEEDPLAMGSAGGKVLSVYDNLILTLAYNVSILRLQFRGWWDWPCLHVRAELEPRSTSLQSPRA